MFDLLFCRRHECQKLSHWRRCREQHQDKLCLGIKALQGLLSVNDIRVTPAVVIVPSSLINLSPPRAAQNPLKKVLFNPLMKLRDESSQGFFLHAQVRANRLWRPTCGCGVLSGFQCLAKGYHFPTCALVLGRIVISSPLDL